MEHRVSVVCVCKNIDSIVDEQGDHACCAPPSVTFQCNKQVRMEMSAKGKEITSDSNVASFDSDVKRGVSSRIGFEGITAISNQEFHGLQSFIVIVQGPQYDVEHRISIISVSKSVSSVFDEETDHWRPDQ